MPSIARPQKVYDFTAHARRQPTTPPPGDRIDAQLANHADAIIAVQLAVEQLTQTAPPQIDVKQLAADIIAHALAEFGDLSQQARNAGVVIEQARLEVARAKADAERAREVADRAEARVAAAVQEAQVAQAALQAATFSIPILGVNAGGPYAGDTSGATATAADYAQVSIDWAEHMPDTIPPNTLAVTAVSGDHWSSRWWANRAASAFGMMAWWYQGAYPSPGPPTTPLTATGQPIPPGAMYFDTTTGQMMVWNGSTWVSASKPAPAATHSLYYLATAGQTVFPLTVADRAGATFAFNQTSPEGVFAYVNGVRLEPTFDFTVDTVASTITFLRGLTVNSVAMFDLLSPKAQLAPSGSVNTVMLNPIVPDGVKTNFTGLTVAANGHAVNVAKNEELLVSVDGVIQQPGGAYSATGAAITFAEAPLANALITLVWFGPSVTTQMVAPASVWSAADAAANGMTLSNGGLTVTASPSLAKALNTSIRGTISKTSGKLYVEFLYIQAGAGNDLVGLADAGFSSSGALGSSIYSEGTGYLTTAVSSGFTTNYSTALYPANTDVFAVAVDFATGKIWLAKNNVWLNSSDPAAGSLPIVSFVPATVGALFPAWTGKSASNAVTLQSTAASQKYAPPAGFTAWDGP